MELDAMMTDDSAEFGDCGDMVDVVGEDRSADMSQERDDMGGLRAPLGCVVQDVASGSAGGAVSVGETAPCVTGIEVDQLPAVVMGGGDVAGQDDRALDASYNPAEEAAGGEEDLGGADDDGADVAVQDRLSPHVAGRAFNTRQSCELLALLARTNYFKWLSDVSNIFQQFRSAG